MRAKWTRVQAAALVVVGGALAGCGNNGSVPGTGGSDASSPGPGLDAGTDATTTAAGRVSLSATKLDFGASPCGGAALASQALTITNQGTGPLSWSVSLDSLQFFTVSSTASGTIAAGQSATVTVVPAAMPASANAGQTMSAALAVSTSDPSAAVTFVPVTATASGATFQLTPVAASFGTVPVGQQAPDIALTLLNVGNAAAAVSFASPGDAQFSIVASPGDGGASTSVAPGASVPGLTARFKPTNSNSITTSSAMTVTGPVCGGAASVAAIPLSGQGTAGAVSVSPGLVDFGNVNCGTTAPPGTTTILNTGNSAITWNASLTGGATSPYSVTPSSGTILAGSQAQITITPKAIPQISAVTPNLYGDTLTITTNVPGDTAHAVAIDQTAYGAILAVTTAPVFSPIHFPAAPPQTQTQTMVVTNSGNIAAPLQISTSTSVFSATSGTAAAHGGTFPSTVKFATSTLGRTTDAITIATTVPLCAPLPSAQPVAGVYTMVASRIAFSGRTKRRTGVDVQSGCAIVQGTGGQIACWGDNSFGEIGIGTISAPVSATIVPGLTGVTAISSSGDANCAVHGGIVSCWGNNSSRNSSGICGRLGTATADIIKSPADVPGVTDAVDVAMGRDTTCALQSAGTVMCWGNNKNSNLGIGTSGSTGVAPALVKNLSGAVALAAGGGGACAIVPSNNPPDAGADDAGADDAGADGGASSSSMACWGRGGGGQLAGAGDTSQALTIPGVSNVTSISTFGTGRNAVRCAAIADGTVSCWGGLQHGGTGISISKTSTPTPTTVANVSRATQVSVGYSFACALLQSGSVECWGRNDTGQLANGTDSDSPVPNLIPGVTNAVQVAAGSAGVCALLSSGSITCWGGAGLQANQPPTPVSGF